MSINYSMITRSKQKNIPPPNNDIDDKGNIEDLIDYGCNETLNEKELYGEIFRLSKGRIKSISIKSKKKKSKIVIEESYISSPKKQENNKIKNKIKKSNSNNYLGDILMAYIIAKANTQIKLKKKKKFVIKIDKDIEYINKSKKCGDIYQDCLDDCELEDGEGDDYEDDDCDMEDEGSLSEKTTTSEENDSEFELNEDEYEEEGEDEEECEDEEEGEDEEDDEEDEEDDIDYDELDDEYIETMDKYVNDNTEDCNLDYFHSLKTEDKSKYLDEIKNIYSIGSCHIPLKFKVLNSNMDLYTKSIAINNLDKLSEMDISTGEYNKMDQWINGLINLPFGKINNLPVSNEDGFDKKREYINETLENMNKAIYGHTEAKTHILQIIGKWIRNPTSLGNVLAIQGPMGNGKTTLIKNGIAKSLNRPFAFVALGGASDSAFFEGHSYTYEGSRWGRIVDILHKCGSMNPIICFDELDKVSDTPKGDEIINMLIHMTDSSQNMKFQDNYFPGIDIDLSKVLFIFSFNDESKINRILKDRMYVVRTNGFEIDDKLHISKKYLLPDIFESFNYTDKDITFTDEILTFIVSKYTQDEKGVRNLKRCLESIVSTLNIYNLTKDSSKEDIVDMKIKDFKLPITLIQENITDLLKLETSDKAPEHMYM